ncbi:MAG: hypothetical protein Kow0037_05280 [Calditrichia bacterium]
MKPLSGVAFLVIMLLLFASCQTDKSPRQAPDEAYAPGYFPNSIGSRWTFSYYDSLLNCSDTVTVEITGDTFFFGGSQKVRIWEYRYRNAMDREYVEISGDTVKIYNNAMVLCCL